MIPDDFELMAYVDGELDARSSKRIAEAVEADPALQAKVDALIESRAVARAAYAPTQEAPLSPALQDMMDDLEAGLESQNDAPAWQSADASPSGGAGMLSWARHRAAAMTAMGVAVGALATWTLMPQTQTEAFLTLTEATGTRLSDRAQRALSQTPAGENVDGFTVQTSFVSGAGRSCRQFTLVDQDGIACLDASEWHLVILTDIAGSSDFQAAGGTDPLAVATAGLGVSRILSDEEEAAQIAQNWRRQSD